MVLQHSLKVKDFLAYPYRRVYFQQAG